MVGASQRSSQAVCHVDDGLGLGERDSASDTMSWTENGWQRYNASQKTDEEAFRALLTAIASRAWPAKQAVSRA